jgi:hypothetical protein
MVRRAFTCTCGRPRGGVGESRADALMDEISGAFLALRHEGEQIIRRVLRRDVPSGAEAANGPDSFFPQPGFDLKGRLGRAVISPRRLQGSHHLMTPSW